MLTSASQIWTYYKLFIISAELVLHLVYGNVAGPGSLGARPAEAHIKPLIAVI